MGRGHGARLLVPTDRGLLLCACSDDLSSRFVVRQPSLATLDTAPMVAEHEVRARTARGHGWPPAPGLLCPRSVFCVVCRGAWGN